MPPKNNVIKQYHDPYAGQRGERSPFLSGALQGLMGTAPDQLGGSVLDPETAQRRSGAEWGFPLGTLAQMLPFGGGIAAAPKVSGRALQSGVIKAPGGNWLSGSVENSLRGLKRPEGNLARQMEAVHGQRIAPIPEADRADALNSWVEKQLTRYVKNDMATPGDPIRLLADAWPAQRDAQLALKQGQVDKLMAKRGAADPRAHPMIDRDLAAVRSEMQGIKDYSPLHVNPDQLNFNISTHGKYLEPGQTAVAQSPAAKSWEGASDLKVFNNKAGDFLPSSDQWVSDAAGSHSVQNNPWLTKVPPDTAVHDVAEPRSLPRDLGFNHLIDELRNATNPESGLPPELLLKYSSLPQVSVPQAVERVAKINAWREAQIAEANAAKANNAATVLHKDYPEHGLKWVELKQPEAKTFDDLTPEQRGWYQEYLDGGVTQDGALRNAAKRGTSLEDALKYEGDTMGHCVGGYTDDVASGKSRIFSLRDSKGTPHVTIETRPGISAYDQWYGSQPVDSPELSEFGNFLKSNKVTGNGGLEQWYRDWRASQGREVVEPQSILQIKGKSNKKPNDEYLPFVQDFVKSQPWSDVGDLQNSGLRKTSDVFGPTEMNKFKENDVELPTHLNDTERKAFQDQWYTLETGKDPATGYAKGGLVQPIYNRPNPRAAQNRNCKCQ